MDQDRVVVMSFSVPRVLRDFARSHAGEHFASISDLMRDLLRREQQRVERASRTKPRSGDAARAA
jgi:Arc/MetJ-type ribon-helix-helix transcriptional regulator